MVAQSYTGGVKPMSIAGRYPAERERLAGMTDAERAFRKQWLQDQVLSPNEPRNVPQMYKALYNPIRRFYRWPLDKLETALAPTMGVEGAHLLRFGIGKFGFLVAGALWFTYYLKYNANTWQHKKQIRIKMSNIATDLGDKEFPKLSDKTKPSDYASRGFKEVKLNL